MEGSDDVRFIEKVIKRLLDDKYLWIRAYEYSHKTPKEVCAFAHSIKMMNADYIFVKDLDFAPCVSLRKEKIRKKYIFIENANILIVKREIECWYLAGLDSTGITELGLKDYDTTDNFTKEEIIRRMPKKYTSKIDFFQEILKRYSVETAKRRNTSFHYFLRKYQVI